MGPLVSDVQRKVAEDLMLNGEPPGMNCAEFQRSLDAGQSRDRGSCLSERKGIHDRKRGSCQVRVKDQYLGLGTGISTQALERGQGRIVRVDAIAHSQNGLFGGAKCQSDPRQQGFLVECEQGNVRLKASRSQGWRVKF